MNRPRRRGFTIIELAVSAVAMLLLLGVLYNLIQRNLYPAISTDDRIGTQKDARMAVAWLTQDIRRAHQLSIDTGKLSMNCFTGKPRTGYPNAGLEAAQVEAIEYYRDGDTLVRENKTTNFKQVVGNDVTDFRPVMAEKGRVVGLIIEAEVEVFIERKSYEKVKTVLYTKVFPRYPAERALYPGYFCSVDEDGTY